MASYIYNPSMYVIENRKKYNFPKREITLSNDSDYLVTDRLQRR